MDQPDPFYDVLVVIHILGAVTGFGALLCTGVFAALARRAGGLKAASTRRYFNGGGNWVARSIYSVPILGLVLLAMSDGTFRLDEVWVVVSLVLWGVAVLLAELVIWPGEQFIAIVAAGRGVADPAHTSLRARTNGVCLRVMVAAAADVVIFGASLVIMLAKPGR
jgi:uncharacterized membrane protein